MQTMSIHWTQVRTTEGVHILMASEKGVCWLGLNGATPEKGKDWILKHTNYTEFIKDDSFPILKKAAAYLEEYLQGKRQTFDLKYDLFISEFQKKALNEMSKIKYGKTKTYKELAVAIGRPQAARAIGSACRTNPVAIFIPCHRVIGSNGTLTGYAGGLSTKEWLLKLEQ